jgi:lipid A 4'-phosphatase
MNLPLTMGRQDFLEALSAIRPRRPRYWLVALSSVWMALFILFNLFPKLDLQASNVFYREAACRFPETVERVCGYFPYSREAALKIIRQILFYAPAIAAIWLLVRLLDNFQHHGATYCRKKTREISIALFAFIAGPLFLVNSVLKEISNRPRPRQTDLFGGSESFFAAGNFGGTCGGNCSFVSGEAAGAGWIACLVLFLPKSLRPVLGPPIVVLSLLSPYLRVAFGGHYLSDVVLGWLLSLVVYAAVATYFEMSQQKIKVG